MSEGSNVFISYSHRDNQHRQAGGGGWVELFTQDLREKLEELLGADSGIFRDTELRENDLLRPEIEKRLGEVKTLVSILSPGYLKSKWCPWEVTRFLVAAQAGGVRREDWERRWFRILRVPFTVRDVPGPEAYSMVLPEEFRNLASLLSKWKTPADAVSDFIRGRASAPLKDDLAAWQPGATPSESLQNQVVDQLNSIVKGESIWDESRFRLINLRPATRALLDARPGGTQSLRLNRLLLEDAYPLELSKSPDSEELKPFFDRIQGNLRRDVNEEANLGFAFYDVDPNTKRPRLFGPRPEDQEERLYRQKVQDLAWALRDLLGQLDDAKSTAVPRDSGSSRKIYLAQTTADRWADRDWISREFLERGYTVLGDEPLPWVANDLRAAVRERLAQCELAIHPIGALLGFVPEGTTESVIQIQHAVAGELAAAGKLKRRSWLPLKLENIEQRQIQFIDSLRQDPSAGVASELIEGTVEYLKEVVLDLLNPPAIAAASSSRAIGGGRPEAPSIYLIGTEQDAEAMAPLEDFLFQRGLNVQPPVFGEDEKQRDEAHQEQLRRADAALIYYHSASPQWLWAKRDELKASLGRRNRDWRALGTCVVPPRNIREARHQEYVTVPFDGQSMDALAPFLDRLTTRG